MNVFLFRNYQTASGAHLASCSMCTGFFPWGTKHPTLEVHHSSLPNAEVKNGWSSSSAATVCFHSTEGWQLLLSVHQGDNQAMLYAVQFMLSEVLGKLKAIFIKLGLIFVV
jgi:hypothetical protein